MQAFQYFEVSIGGVASATLFGIDSGLSWAEVSFIGSLVGLFYKLVSLSIGWVWGNEKDEHPLALCAFCCCPFIFTGALVGAYFGISPDDFA